MLKMLLMSNNDIGDDGITAITTALTNSRIKMLMVCKCGITLTGARHIATLLSVSNSIEELWLIDNPITEDGAHLILQSAVNNKACQVNIIMEYKSDEVQTMMKILGDRRKTDSNKVPAIREIPEDRRQTNVVGNVV